MHTEFLTLIFLINKKFGLERDYRLLKIKNPKVQKWKGDWSSESTLWTDDIKKYLNYNDSDKGELFITFEDYCNYFYKTTICFYEPKMKYNNLVLSHEKGKSCIVKIDVKSECKIHFKIVQFQRCLFPRTFKYKVSRTHFVMGKYPKSKDDIKFICAFTSNIDQNFSIKPDNSFKPGVYYIFLQLDWNHENINQFCFNYLSNIDIEAEEIYLHNNLEFLKSCIKSYAKSKVKKFRTPKKSKGIEIKHENGKNTGGYGFYYYENNNK